MKTLLLATIIGVASIASAQISFPKVAISQCGSMESTNGELLYATQLSFEPATNWTGQIFQDRELGYVVMNHVLTVEYENTTNRFTLKTTVSDKAVWRPKMIIINGDSCPIADWWDNFYEFRQAQLDGWAPDDKIGGTAK